MPADIQHVVVLMLENRSFDSMLGRLYPPSGAFNGLTLNETNYYGLTYGVWNDPNMTPAAFSIPDPDPYELFEDMNEQLFGNRDRRDRRANMAGFAQNYGAPQPSSGYRDPGAVMHYFDPVRQIPSISNLATAFGVCDDWYASAPCQTWPNRFFAHTGTALGYVDNHTFPMPFDAPSIFRRLEDNRKDWRVYFHDMPQSILLRDVWLYAPSHYRFFGQFLADAHAGVLPSYSFIEPRYFANLFINHHPNDQHPPHNVLYGEQLIVQVYNAVRSSRCWKNTLLVITYDEHGGLYDHVPPPPATPPDANVNTKYKFAFDTYGVRVPAVLVSPWIPPGSRIRSPGYPVGDGPRTGRPFDHTSIIKTVREVFSLGGQLTARDNVAPSLTPALSLAAPNNDGPASLASTLDKPDPGVFESLGQAVPNAMQAMLASAAAALPTTAPATEAQIPNAVTPDARRYATIATAQAAATACTKAFLGL
ncbi:MAG TPA: alkaline phosphatase family protein [Steroidobacteraceae bacterium]|jgi:phospholipase C|nr:alkaline phosphatase family protein [Steroidobacteraceae bacterium]